MNRCTYKFINPRQFALTYALCGALSLAHATDQSALSEIIVNATLTNTTLQDSTSATSIISGDDIVKSQKRFIAEHLTSAPNVNFSSGASRGRYFQIRGTGERSQFVDPINPSVGLYIDGIDFSGFANVANLFDIERIEILRGPQGSSAGANASAGLINIVSNAPTQVFGAEITGGLNSIDGNNGDIDGHHTGLMLNGALSDSVNARLSVMQNYSDGFTDNVYLNRDDTSQIDEILARGKLHWTLNDDVLIASTLFFSEVDNGYDGFTLDNTRQTITDEPGFDKQTTRAVSIKPKITLSEKSVLSLNFSHSDDEIDYGYDEDWTFTGFDIAGYTSFDRYLRQRKNTTVDIRVNTIASSLEWSSGIYLKQQTVDLNRNYRFDANFNGQYDADEFSPFRSEYDSESAALYAEVKLHATDILTLSSGLRFEHISSDYRDSLGEMITPSDTLWGGHLSASLALNDQLNLFSRLSRGFKAAGINADGASSLPANSKSYDDESLLNIELGSNFDSKSGKVRGQITAFFQQRKDAQIKQSLVTPITPPNCPCSFEDYIDNANETEHYGLELESFYQAHDRLTFSLSVGYLKAEFSDYLRLTEGAGGTVIAEDLDGRNVANAPEYQFALDTTFGITDNLTLWLQLEGRDQYFFSNRHDGQSTAYELLNGSLTYSIDSWEVALWSKNLANANYYTRGFGSFGNDPRKGYVTEPYYQFGEPREIGVRATYKIQ